MSDLLTIVVPTYNRPRELARLLTFHSLLGSTIRTLVLDGSNPENAARNREFCRSLPLVEHHEYGPDYHPVLRVARGVEMVRTPFLVFCGDDDFVFPDAALECARFLQTHPDHSAALGKVWSLRYFPHRPVVRGGLALGSDLDNGDHFSHSRFIQRALAYFSYTAIGAPPLFYAVCRTDQAAERFSFISTDLKYSSDEVLLVGMLLIKGKFAKLPLAFGCRDYASVPVESPNREGSSSYVPAEDLAFLRPLFVTELMKSERVTVELAEYLVDSVLSLWNKDVSRQPILAETRGGRILRSVNYGLQCLVSRLAPATSADVLGLPRPVYHALMSSHRRFTARPP